MSPVSWAKEWLFTMSGAPDARRLRARIQPGDQAALERVFASVKTRLGLAADAPCGAATKRGATDFGRIGF